MEAGWGGATTTAGLSLEKLGVHKRACQSANDPRHLGCAQSFPGAGLPEEQPPSCPEGAQGLEEQRVASVLPPGYHEELKAALSIPSPALWQMWGWACGASNPTPGTASPSRMLVARLPDEVQ